MIERLKTTLRPPVFADDEDKTFSASLVHIIAWALLLSMLVYTLLSPIPASRQGVAWLYVLAIAAMVGSTLWLTRRGLVQPAALLLTGMLWLILTVAAYTNGGVLSPAYGGYIVVVVIGGLLLGWRAAALLALLSAGAGAVMLIAEPAGLLPEWRSTYDAVAVWGAQVAYLLSAALLLALALQAIRRSLTRAHREIAERRQAEQALRNSEQRFRAIFDAVNDAIFVHDLSDGRILDVNQKMCEMYGYTADEARDLAMGDLSAGSAPFTQHEALSWMQQAAGGEPQIFEWQAKDRTGRLFWVEVNMRQAAIDGRDRLLVVMRDIDERKRSEAALRREQAYNQAIVNATPVMLWLKDTENRILRFNPAAAKIEGIDAARAEGKSAYDLYSREQAEAYYRDDLEVIRTGQPKLGIIEQYRVAGTSQTMWVEMGKVPVSDNEGNIVGVLACAIDITTRKEAERVQAASRQIAEAALLAQNLEEFYQAVYAAISPLIPASNFYISLYDAANDLFHVPCLFDEFDKAWAPYRPGRGLSAYVMRTGEPLLVTPETFAELEQKGEAEILNRPMVEWLGVPLKTAQGVLGVMAVQNYSSPARLREKHKDLLMFVSAQVAMAIERKRAEEREQRVSQGLRAVIAAADDLLACANLDELHRHAVELGRERLGLERCGLFLYDEAQGQLLGTYGTDERGQTTDEHGARLDAREHDELLALPDQLWQVKYGERAHWRDREHIVGAEGWIACTLLRERGRIIGVLYNDTLLSGAPLNEPQQEVVAVYCSMLGNLIELKRAEAAVRESEALFRYLADNAPAMISLTDESGATVYLNHAWQEFRGSGPDWQARLHPGDRDRYLHEVEAARQARRTYQLEYRLRRADGQYRWLFDTSVPRFTAGSQFTGFIGIAIDITDRKNAEEALLHSEARLRLVTENMEDSVSQIDARQRFVYVSPSMERMSGFPLRALLGRSFLERIHPDDATRLQHQMLMATGLRLPTIRLDYRFVHSDGHEIWLEAEIRFMYNKEGELAGAILSARDISTRRRVELERENLIRELEDKNAELERFTYTVSHDLKSPLITIRGFLGFLEKDAQAGNFDRLHADVQRIGDAASRMQRLLDDLLVLSRVGRLLNPAQEVSFEAIAREAVDLVRGRLTVRGIQVEIAPQLPMVYGDRTRLIEVVQNLLDNAAKFMGAQPEPRITIGMLGDKQTGLPIFFVQDNGAGIDPAYHERIFGLFNKLDAQSEGTGVGLALVKRIIDLHNGHIWVESDGAGKGSTFFFTLPQPPVSAVE